MFVLLTAPIVFYLMFEKQMISSRSYQCDMKLKAKYKMIKLLFIILMNANHTGNILVYCLTGTEFRTQLFHVLHLFGCRENHSFIQGQYIVQRTGTFNDVRRLSAVVLNKDSAYNQSLTSRTSSRKQFRRNTPPPIQQKSKGKKVICNSLFLIVINSFVHSLEIIIIIIIMMMINNNNNNSKHQFRSIHHHHEKKQNIFY
jgi:hypothetical protein